LERRDPAEARPDLPDLRQEGFMAYQAIISGARGLVFFGHIREVMSQRDAVSGWNWTFWRTVLKPLVHELTSTAVGPCLTAPTVSLRVAADATDVRMSAREAAGFLYLLTCRRSPTAHSPVRFSGLAAGVKEGQVLFEYDHADFRTVRVASAVATQAMVNVAYGPGRAASASFGAWRRRCCAEAGSGSH
jgi:hypothetical protein